MMLRVEHGDITAFAGDAIVNAANEGMLGGGGVDGAIHRAAGPQLRNACAEVEEVRPGVRCPTGQARITGGFGLAARHVIHTAGPVWRGGGANEADLLAACYRAAMVLAMEHELRSIAFPAISCGAYRFPADYAATIAVQTVRACLAGPTSIEEVVFFAFDAEMRDNLERAVAARS